MKVQASGFEPCYNAQLAGDRDRRLIVAPGLTQAANDQQQLIPALESLRALPPELGTVQALVADNGFLSEPKVRACAGPEAGDATPIAPRIAMGLGVPCLQRKTHAPDAKHLNDGSRPINIPTQPVGSAIPWSDDPCIPPTVDHAESDRLRSSTISSRRPTM